MAEGFQASRPLARKFVGLHTAAEGLLSPARHYDWKLRAIKTTLAVAGAARRAPGAAALGEARILLRALRDFNVGKLAADDAAVFGGLLEDLFPGLPASVPRGVDARLEAAVSYGRDERSWTEADAGRKRGLRCATAAPFSHPFTTTLSLSHHSHNTGSRRGQGPGLPARPGLPAQGKREHCEREAKEECTATGLFCFYYMCTNMSSNCFRSPSFATSSPSVGPFSSWARRGLARPPSGASWPGR